jgi:hypothetical protein
MDEEEECKQKASIIIFTLDSLRTGSDKLRGCCKTPGRESAGFYRCLVSPKMTCATPFVHGERGYKSLVSGYYQTFATATCITLSSVYYSSVLLHCTDPT